MKIALPFGISLGLVGVMTMLSLGLISALPADTQLPIHFTLTASPGIYLIVWLVTLLILALAHGFIIRHALFTLAAMKATA
ncbi:MAG: hypothetical protein EOP17_12990 [Rhizobiaceae bacterium]|nr:MAG: hypothetical protein EOP17_12990 [Rhizobiaceae bacterium]